MSNKIKLTNEKINNFLIDRNIQRLDNFINTNSKMNWKCLKQDCNHIWQSTTNHIINRNQGCPKCAGIIKLTNEDIDNKIFDRNIKRLEKYINSKTKIRWQCINCSSIWLAAPGNILFGTGCPQCAGNMKYTNKNIDDKLVNLNIKRLDNYIGAHIKTKWLCLENNCGHIWLATTNSILNNNTKCPKCAGNIPLTNQVIDEKLSFRPIKRLGNYININTKMEWQCLNENCDHIWLTTTSSILHQETGCPKCSRIIAIKKTIRTQKEIENILLPREIKLISQYVNNTTFSDFKCLKKECGYEWNAICRNVLNNNRGCPKCANRLPLSNEIIDQHLINKDIERLGNCINSATKIEFKCLVDGCGFIWSAKPNSIQQGHGCPKCYGGIKYTNDNVDIKLQNENPLVIRKGDFLGKYIKTLWECADCRYQWMAQPQGIFAGSGCPLCNNAGKNEKYIFKYFKENNIEFEHQKLIKKLNANEEKKYKVDFYFPHQNLIIEYNGHQHYQPVCFGGMDGQIAKEKFIHQKARDQYIEKFCKCNNIQLIWIDGRKYKNKNLKKYIINEIIPMLTGSI